MKDYLGLGNIKNSLGLGNNINKKEEFSYLAKIKTIQRQENICPKCQKSFSESKTPEFYQINNDLPDNSEKNCQALHPECHSIITKEEVKEQVNPIKKEYPQLPNDSDNMFYKLDYNDLI